MGWCWLDSSGCLMGFYRVVPVLTGFYWVLLGFTGFYRVSWLLFGLSSSCIEWGGVGWTLLGVYWVFTELYRFLQGFTGFYWVLPSFVAFVWAVIELH